ncbi:hypothetical protein PENSPDRAFT_130620 [Peniophora sp. CONT]|nr:hypothetical protein PENSPDRAFT_130620 [Peniophora sp. CONT]
MHERHDRQHRQRYSARQGSATMGLVACQSRRLEAVAEASDRRTVGSANNGIGERWECRQVAGAEVPGGSTRAQDRMHLQANLI